LNEDAAVFVGVATLMAIVVCLLVMLGVAAVTQSACLSHGYPHGAVTVTFERYCSKRIDQTDVVVPLSEVRRRR